MNPKEPNMSVRHLSLEIGFQDKAVVWFEIDKWDKVSLENNGQLELIRVKTVQCPLESASLLFKNAYLSL